MIDLPDFEKSRRDLDTRVLTLLLPVAALGIDGESDAKIIVEYTQDRNNPVNPNQFVINIWLMETDINMRMGVTTIFLPTIENEGAIEQAARILSAVANSEAIQEKLAGAIMQLRKSNSKYVEFLVGQLTSL